MLHFEQAANGQVFAYVGAKCIADSHKPDDPKSWNLRFQAPDSNEAIRDMLTIAYIAGMYIVGQT